MSRSENCLVDWDSGGLNEPKKLWERVLRTKLAIKINTHIQPTDLRLAGLQNKNKFNVQTKSGKIIFGEKIQAKATQLMERYSQMCSKP